MIPMAVLVAVMIMVSVATIDRHSIHPATLRRMPLSENLVMLLTVGVTVATGNLAYGVIVGVNAAIIVFARRVARFASIEPLSDADATAGVRTYKVRGEMFFATSNDLVYQFDHLGDPDRLVIDFSDSHIWDASTVAALDAVRHQVRQARQVRGDRGRERVVRRPPRAAIRPPRRDGRMTRPRPASRAGPACHGDAEDRLEQRVGVGAHGRRLGTGVEPAFDVGGGCRQWRAWSTRTKSSALGSCPVAIGPRGDLAPLLAQDSADRLDRVALGPQLGNEHHDQRLRGSSPPAKKIEALRRISLSSSSRRTLAFSSLISARSSLVTPWPQFQASSTPWR